MDDENVFVVRPLRIKPMTIGGKRKLFVNFRGKKRKLKVKQPREMSEREFILRLTDKLLVRKKRQLGKPRTKVEKNAKPSSDQVFQAQGIESVSAAPYQREVFAAQQEAERAKREAEIKLIEGLQNKEFRETYKTKRPQEIAKIAQDLKKYFKANNDGALRLLKDKVGPSNAEMEVYNFVNTGDDNTAPTDIIRVFERSIPGSYATKLVQTYDTEDPNIILDGLALAVRDRMQVEKQIRSEIKRTMNAPGTRAKASKDISGRKDINLDKEAERRAREELMKSGAFDNILAKTEDLTQEQDAELQREIERQTQRDAMGAGRAKNGITDLALQKLAEKMIPKSKLKYFTGVITADEIGLQPAQIPQFFIANTMTNDYFDKFNNPIGHWVAIGITNDSIEYFDPFGNTAPRNIMRHLKHLIKKIDPEVMLKLKENRVRWQHLDSDSCGFISLYFILKRLSGQTFAKATGFDSKKIDKTNIGEGFATAVRTGKIEPGEFNKYL